MLILRASLLALAGLAVSVPAVADPVLTNGDFSQYTTTNTDPNLGFQNGYNGSITGWSSGPLYPGTGNDQPYNFLFLQQGNGSTAGSADYGGVGEYSGTVSLWDANNGGVSSWDGNGPGSKGNFVAMDGAFGTSALQTTVTGLTAGQGYYITLSYAFAQQYGFDGATVQNLFAAFGSDVSYQPYNYHALYDCGGCTLANPGGYSLANHDFSGWITDTFWVQADSTSDVLSLLAYGNLELPPFALVADVSITDAPEPASLALLGVGLVSVIGLAHVRRARAAKQGSASF